MWANEVLVEVGEAWLVHVDVADGGVFGLGTVLASLIDLRK